MPEAPYLGQQVLVVDTAQLQVWDGDEWVQIGGGEGGAAQPPLVIATSAPSSPSTGLQWFNPTTDELNVWTGSWEVVRDPQITTVLTMASDALAAASTASSTANSALAAATAPLGTNVVGTTQLAPTAITNKHTLTNPTVNAMTMTGSITMGGNNINTAGTVNTAAMGVVTGSTFIAMPEIRPTNCYVTTVPVATGGSTVFMGSTGRLFIHTSAKKYKKNIKDLDIEARDILQLRPVSYDLRKNVVDDDFETDGTGEIGFIADEAAELGFEELVGRGEDDQIETFHYHKMSILQQIVIRKQQQELDSLRADVEMLKAALTGKGD